MNKHIELIKKWLNDLDSVSQSEWEDNAAANAYAAVDYAYNAADYRAADASADASAAHWVRRYKELS
jgi:hypothetical protein